MNKLWLNLKNFYLKTHLNCYSKVSKMPFSLVFHSCCNVISLRPSGNLIVCSQQKPNKHDVIFLEKNGLQHGEFTLPSPKGEKLVSNSLISLVSLDMMYWRSDYRLRCSRSMIASMHTLTGWVVRSNTTYFTFEEWCLSLIYDIPWHSTLEPLVLYNYNIITKYFTIIIIMILLFSVW